MMNYYSYYFLTVKITKCTVCEINQMCCSTHSICCFSSYDYLGWNLLNTKRCDMSQGNCTCLQVNSDNTRLDQCDL